MYSQIEHDKAIFYFDILRDMCCDIDIQEDADCLVLGNEEEKCSYKLSDVNKVFPQVKTLYIGPNVIDIVIRNAMFPNVEKVISDNPMFASGNMLVKHHILLNAFYQTDDAVIDLKDVFLIKAFAFNGCRAKKFINTADIKVCSENAFCECKLSAVEFNHTMTHFEQCCGNGIFSSCGTFSELEIPGYVKGLSKNMFSNSKINKLVLNEGLESIESGALSGYPAHEITLPKSLKYVGNYNFSQATVIHVTGKRVPYGLLKAVTSTYSHRKADGEIIITLIVNGKTYYLPRHMPSKLAARLDELFSFYDVVPEDEIDGLFQKDGMNAIDKSLRQDMMICLYDITKKDCYKQLLKNAKKSIVKRLFENGDEKQLIRFFSFGFFASKSLDNFIKLASEKEMVVLVSYLLEEQKKKSPKKSTKFNI